MKKILIELENILFAEVFIKTRIYQSMIKKNDVNKACINNEKVRKIKEFKINSYKLIVDGHFSA